MFEGDFLVDKEFLFEFISASCMGMIDWWLKEKCKKTPEYIAEQLTKISILGSIRTLGMKILEMVNLDQKFF
ncbi:MAG: TetR-like C-terminal domain-containing protein [Sarcina sp.]